MERVGLIGLGNMGTGMAKNLVKKGFKLMVYDIRDEALEKMAELGAGFATSPQQVGEQSQVVFIMVLNGAQSPGGQLDHHQDPGGDCRHRSQRSRFLGEMK